jgi:RND family efflux transporter MFP subunit
VGIVAPRDEVRLSFKSGGVIASISVEEGAAVRAGQRLAVLQQAEIGAAVEQAREATRKAERDLGRARALFADGVATEEQVQDLTTALNVARAAQRSAEFNARFTRIEAPAEGVVLRRMAEPGELVGPGQPVLVVGGTGRGWVVRAALADRDVVRLRQGDRARITLDAFPGRTFEGRVDEIPSAADPVTGTFEVEFLVDAGDAHFVQGLVARVVLAEASAGAVPVIPVEALLEANRDRASVFVVDANHAVARRVQVRLGRMVGGRVEVRAGLATGQQVVTEGAAYLRDGAPVRVLAAG